MLDEKSRDSAKIFISHAVVDAALASALSNLLQLGVGVRADHIFCCSIEGLNIETGTNFISYIEDKLSKASLFIPLFSQNFLESRFCLCEMGAAWALKKTLFPVSVSPVGPKDVNAILSVTQLAEIDSAPKLGELRDKIGNLLNMKVYETAIWEREKTLFLKKIGDSIRGQSPSKFVSRESYTALQKNFESSKAEIAGLVKKSEEQKVIISELKSVKDAASVSAVMQSHSGEQKKYEALVEECRDLLLGLPSLVRKAIYLDISRKPLVLGPINGGADFVDANEAEDQGYIKIDGNLAYPNRGDSTVDSACESLGELNEFLSEHSSGVWYRELKDKCGLEPQLKNSRFWDSIFK
jgi:hypothetical protein